MGDKRTPTDLSGEIFHDHDGPVNPYVAVCRALQLAASGADVDVLADLLHDGNVLSQDTDFPPINPRAY